MSKLVTNYSLFAKRGDPWVTGREGREKFGRNLSSEDPDMDRWTRAGFARRQDVPNVGGVPINKVKPAEAKDDPLRRAAAKRLAFKKRYKTVEESMETQAFIDEERERRSKLINELEEEGVTNAEDFVKMG